MGDTIEISIEYRAADFASAARYVHVRERSFYILCAALLCIAAGWGLVIWIANSTEHAPLVAGALVLAVWAGLAVAVPLRLRVVGGLARRNFESNPAFRHPIMWRMTESELKIEGTGVTATLALGNYVRATETFDGILLWQSKGQYNYLPKRAIADKETLARVRDCLRTGLPQTARIDLW